MFLRSLVNVMLHVNRPRPQCCLRACAVLQMAEQEQYQQLGAYSDEHGQHYAAMYAAQQMGIAQMSAYADPATLAAWQVRVMLGLIACLQSPAGCPAQRRCYTSAISMPSTELHWSRPTRLPLNTPAGLEVT